MQLMKLSMGQRRRIRELRSLPWLTLAYIVFVLVLAGWIAGLPMFEIMGQIALGSFLGFFVLMLGVVTYQLEKMRPRHGKCRTCDNFREIGRCVICGGEGPGGLELPECPEDNGELEIIPCPTCRKDSD